MHSFQQNTHKGEKTTTKQQQSPRPASTALQVLQTHPTFGPAECSFAPTNLQQTTTKTVIKHKPSRHKSFFCKTKQKLTNAFKSAICADALKVTVVKVESPSLNC
jgi:hypothetical protein